MYLESLRSEVLCQPMEMEILVAVGIVISWMIWASFLMDGFFSTVSEFMAGK